MQFLKEELEQILKSHRAWLRGEAGGRRAYLRGADLSGAYLRGADLSGAYLRGADLSGAYLRDADLSGADLSDADLSDADLSDADLSDAYLRGAYLRGADLSDADLRGAYLRDADLSGADLELLVAKTRCCPEEGAFIAWKSNVRGDIIKIEVPAEAKRLTAIGSRKCRAEFVRVLEIVDRNGKHLRQCGGWKNSNFTYTVGETVYPDSYDDDPRIECTHGIHFFISRQEAVDWAK